MALGRESCQAAKEAGYQESFAAASLTQLHLAAGETESAANAFASVNDEMDPGTWMLTYVTILHARGELELKQGRPAAAVDTLNGLLKRMTAESVRCFLPSVQLTKARSLVAAGHFDNAQEVLLEALTTAEQSGARMTAWQILTEMAGLEDDAVEADRLRRDAMVIVQGITEEMPVLEMRQAFLNQAGF